MQAVVIPIIKNIVIQAHSSIYVFKHLFLDEVEASDVEETAPADDRK